MDSFFAFDETLSTIDDHTMGVIGDYLIYQNKDAITTKNCFEEIEKAKTFTSTQLLYLKGLFEDELVLIPNSTPKQSMITHLNYISQFKPIVLLTKQRYEQQGSDKSILSKSVRVRSFSEIVTLIESDEDFEVWKLKVQREMLRIQKMDSEVKQKKINDIDEKINKKTQKVD